MKNNTIFRRALCLIVVQLVIFSQSASAQDKQITIRYIGNCGLHITDGETNIYSDFPYKSGAHNYAEYPESELDSIEENVYFIFTHKHSDHYYKGKVNKILKKKQGKKFGKWNIDELEKLSEVIPEFEIKAFKTKHNFSFGHYSYLITWHGKKIYLSGDTESAETFLGVEGIDWAFVPAWLITDMSEKKVDWKNLNCKKMAIYHIGPNDNVQITGEIFVMLKTRGELITIPY